jgi:hypothetical protein
MELNQNYIDNFFRNNNDNVIDNNYSIKENIIFIIEINDKNLIYFNDLLIHDYFLTNIPFINVVIFNQTNKILPKFQFDTNNIQIENNIDNLKEIILKYDKIFYAYITKLFYFSFQNWLYYIRFNNIEDCCLFKKENITIFINNKNFYIQNNNFNDIKLINFKNIYNINLIIDPIDNEFYNFYINLHNINSEKIDLNNENHLLYLEYCHKVFFNNYRIMEDNNPIICEKNIELNNIFSNENLIKFNKECIIFGHAGWADIIHNSSVVRYIHQQFKKTYFFTYSYLLDILQYLYNDLNNIDFILNIDINHPKIFNLFNILNKEYVIICIGFNNIFNSYIDFYNIVPNIDNTLQLHNKYKLNLNINEKYQGNYGLQQYWALENHINISVLNNYFKINRIKEYEDNIIMNINNNIVNFHDKCLGKNIINFNINEKFVIIHDNSINDVKNDDDNINIKKYINCNNILQLANLTNKMFDIIPLFYHKNLIEIHVINSIWLHILYFLKIKYNLVNVKIFVHDYCRIGRKPYKKCFLYPELKNIIWID